jgi:hypothetical protein
MISHPVTPEQSNLGSRCSCGLLWDIGREAAWAYYLSVSTESSFLYHPSLSLRFPITMPFNTELTRRLGIRGMHFYP